MNDGVKIMSIGAVAIVTVLSFILLPEDATLHHTLAYGLLSLVGVNLVGSAISWTINKMGRNNE